MLGEAEQLTDEADLVVLDLMLPDGSGLEFLRTLRTRSRVPVIILSSRNEEIDRVLGLEMGADDYIAKPFSLRELAARVRAVLRRHDEPPESSGCEFLQGPRGLTLEPAALRASVNDVNINLSKTEFDLLYMLVGAPGRVFTRDQMLNRVWGENTAVSDRTVDAHIKTLRKKLEGSGVDPQIIETVRSMGYRLREEDC